MTGNKGEDTSPKEDPSLDSNGSSLVPADTDCETHIVPEEKNQTNYLIQAEQYNTVVKFPKEFSPEDCEKYEAIYPGATEVIFKGIEREQLHRHEMNRTDIKLRGQYIKYDYEFKGRGQIVSGVVLAIIVLSENICVLLGKMPTPYLTYIAFASITVAFISGKFRSYEEEEEEEEE